MNHPRSNVKTPFEVDAWRAGRRHQWDGAFITIFSVISKAKAVFCTSHASRRNSFLHFVFRFTFGYYGFRFVRNGAQEINCTDFVLL
ncbi:hypothetical protein CEXT_407061 [Caerostris extrusa]|uniref:Uncharacterized protein n=1 Tax=Caerostris extrusa TaxID=172846 RepID=A0AAV4MD71_CAEEX|nr:hypothetical protein CEXT_407061 [Caerostris extrusa]